MGNYLKVRDQDRSSQHSVDFAPDDIQLRQTLDYDDNIEKEKGRRKSLAKEPLTPDDYIRIQKEVIKKI